jgi:hypothetical protein
MILSRHHVTPNDGRNISSHGRYGYPRPTRVQTSRYFSRWARSRSQSQPQFGLLLGSIKIPLTQTERRSRDGVMKVKLTLSSGPRVFDKPGPKWRCHLIRRVCTLFFAGTWKVSNAFVDRDHQWFSCRQLDITRLDRYDDRLHA